MEWHDRKDAILRRTAQHPVLRLGEGDEAEVYALDQDRIIRFFKRHVDPTYIAKRGAFYAGLDASTVAFAIPSIIEHGIDGDVCYSIERRIPGSSLVDLLARLKGEAREDALTAYAGAVTAIRRIGYNGHVGYGEVMADPPIRSDTWKTCVLTKAETCLRESRIRLRDGIVEPERALRILERMLAYHGPVERHLVHGDFYSANVIVEAEGTVTGVIDFGPLTLVGDWRLDAASALLYLTGMDGITEEDKKVVHSCLTAIGLREQDVALYRLFYAFLFLDTKKAALLDWCRGTIETACSA
ncbi:phosphotransferase family protein [Lichenifustis flavocetrariae]|uniref:Aminoglycoside phosphotransferase family protein n=1 Tax=Lichenifustis flavocetrariae TaxID=2949735 RepID=A0AA41Z3F3_9HYPH|nr:aminoglycoside phosphotransferase family protein [Lichenifustis flavocetrariae]MCW6512075.1 aminoglycoside phosphotransferase family protein [Lichenifustis flavocetrariae]